MTITLKEGAPEQLDCKTYPLSGKELQVLKKALDDDVKKGYIKHGTSSYISPIFFIPKKDGEELCMVIDYRKLNDLTKRTIILFLTYAQNWRNYQNTNYSPSLMYKLVITTFGLRNKTNTRRPLKPH